MKIVPLACTMLVVATLPVAAQDPVKVASANYTLIAENEHVRVLRGTMAPGAKTPMHSHPAHVAVILSGATFEVGLPDGKTTASSGKPDDVMLMPAGSHTMANKGTGPVDVIVIEMKGTPGTAAFPTSRPGMKMTRVLQDARVEAYRVSADSSFHEPAGTTHGFDQVVVPLGNADIALTMDGKTTSAWKRGDARLIGRGVAHESKGGKTPADMIIVAIK